MTLRTLFYSQDGFGLGHLRRTSALAARLVAVYPDVEVLMLTDSPRPDLFPPPRHVRRVSLPCLVRTGPEDWSPAVPGGTLPGVLARRQAAIVRAVEDFAPDVVVVDHLPLGGAGELAAVLPSLRRNGARLVLGLRDILDAPEVVSPLWARNGSFTALRELYDAILVYGSEDLLDVAAAYGFPADVAAKVRHCGYVAAPGSRVARSEPPLPTIVAMVGGGADAYGTLGTVFDALEVLAADAPWEMVAVTGPFLPAHDRRRLEARAASVPARVVASVPDVPSLLARATVVVSRAGYNSTVEACASGVPTVLVPRAGPSAEQRMRAACFAGRGWVATVDPSCGGAAVAAAVVGAVGSEAPVADGGPDLGGLDRAVRHVLDLVTAAPVSGSP